MFSEYAIHIPWVIGGMVAGICIGLYFGLFFRNRSDTSDARRLIATALSFFYSALWVYWHLQAAQGSWAPVAPIFDAIGGITTALMLGIDISVIGRLVGNSIDNISKTIKDAKK